MMKRLFIQFYPQLILFLLVIIIGLTNANHNTWLTGWDNLHPEFNFLLNIKRSIFAVWQGNQGLGHVGGHGHAAELLRQIILFFLNFFFPTNLLRYLYNLLCLFMGGWGMYVLLKKIFLRDNIIPSLLGSLFYMLNLGTVQIFYIQYETFTTHFALLPWLFYSVFYFIFYDSKKSLLFFLIINFLASIQGFLPSLFLIYFLTLLVYLIIFNFLNKKCAFKKIFLLLVLTCAINSYWLIPFVYSTSNNVKVFKEAKINKISTEEHYFKSLKASNLDNAIFLKGLWFNQSDWQIEKNKIVPIMGEWVNYSSTKLVRLVGYTIFLTTLIGTIYIFIKRKILVIPAATLFFIFFAFYSNQTLPFFYLLKLYEKLPLFKDIFRLYFTKTAIITAFLYTIVFASGVSFLLQLKLLLKIRYFLICIFVAGLFLLSYPTFNGNLFYKNLKQKIPEEYFALFSFFSKNNQYGRILRLPIHTYVYWDFYRWGYRGSGFLWYGIPNSILDRAFDVWSPYNEQAFREFFYAIYSKNQNLFEKILSKYNIKYILLDENVIIPGDEDQEKKLFYSEIKTLLSTLPTTKLIKKFGEKISLFEFLPNKEKQPVEILTDYKIVEPAYRWNYIDKAYQDVGNYITFPNQLLSNVDYIYSARNILNEEEKINKKILSINEISYQITFPISESLKNGEIKIPNLAATESEFYTKVYIKKKNQKTTIELKYILPYLANNGIYNQEFEIEKDLIFFSLNNKVFEIPQYLSEEPTYLGEEILYTQKENYLDFYRKTPISISYKKLTAIYPYLCSTAKENQIFGAESTGNGFKMYAQKAKVCLDLPLKEIVNLEKEGALKVWFNYQIREDGKAEFCLFDNSKNRCLFSKSLKPSFSPQVNFYIPLNQEKFDSFSLRFSLDTQEKSIMKELSIENINLNFYEKEKHQPFFAEIPSFKLTTNEFKLEGIFPQEKVNINAENIGLEKKDCSFKKAKFIDKQFIKEANEFILEYKAKDGAVCDVVSFPNLSQNIGYILAIESQNVSGLPLKICLKNAKSEICDLEEKLSKNKNIAFDYFLIPPYHNGYGYHLLLTNYSIGNILSINRIKSIQIIPFPYNFFQSIRWEGKNQKVNPINKKIKTEIKFKSPFVYQIEITHPLLNNSLLVLDQAYEKNWKAYFSETCNVERITCKIKNIFNTFFPFIFGKEIKDHVLVNNWANGFLVETSQSSSKLVATNSNQFQPVSTNSTQFQPIITIIFFPQYLEFLGFLMMGVGLILVLKYPKIKKYENVEK